MSGGVRFTGGALILAAQGVAHLVREAVEMRVQGGVRFTGGALEGAWPSGPPRKEACNRRALHGRYALKGAWDTRNLANV